MSRRDRFTVSALQRDAWAAWNASYQEQNGDVYRMLGSALYREHWQEQIRSLFAKLDEQNAELDARLAASPPGAIGSV